MQVLIDISDRAYEYAKTRMALFLDVNTEILKAVENGTVLPEKHGDLKDADALKADAQTMTEWNGDVFRCVTERAIDLSDTIIPATKGERLCGNQY